MWLKWRTKEIVAACLPLQNSATHLPSKSGTAQKELGLDTTVLCSFIYICLSSYKTELSSNLVNGTVYRLRFAY